MKHLIKLAALATIISFPVIAGSNDQQLCGPNHRPGTVEIAEIKVNSDGYFIVNTNEQIPFGDSRLVSWSSEDLPFCMETVVRTRSPHPLYGSEERTQVVKFLFIPNGMPAEATTS